MTKSITKTKGRKRPKSVLQKAWETRRKYQAAAKIAELSKEMMPGNSQPNMSAQGLALLAKGTPTSETAIPRSDAAQANGINTAYAAEITDLKRDYRDRQLRSFQGDFRSISRGRMLTDSTPLTLSWEQARAIHEYLLIEGYTAFGNP